MIFHIRRATCGFPSDIARDMTVEYVTRVGVGTDVPTTTPTSCRTCHGVGMVRTVRSGVHNRRHRLDAFLILKYNRSDRSRSL
jgi:hypothetical protein